MLSLIFKSLWNRKTTVLLSVLSISVSVGLLLSVERLRVASEESFEQTLSGTDLLVGARTGPIQLLLYSIFQMGNPTNNISWKSFEHWSKHPEVEWTLPLSLGDSHRGYRVLGSTQDFFRLYQYGGKQRLKMARGSFYSNETEVVLGAEVAWQLGYDLGHRLTLSHGVSEISLQHHDESPFKVVGILKKTGTPLDRTVLVSLAAIERVHVGWEDGAPPLKAPSRKLDASTLRPKSITAFLVGLKSKLGIFQVRQEINDYQKEPMMAVIPSLVFRDLWKTVGVVEKVLRAISWLVVLTGLLGMMTTMLMSLSERRREIAVLRSVGAGASTVFTLLLLEVVSIAVLGSLCGFGVVSLATLLLQEVLASEWGLYLHLTSPQSFDILVLIGVVLLASAMGTLPAWKAYRRSLADGLTIKI